MAIRARFCVPSQELEDNLNPDGPGAASRSALSKPRARSREEPTNAELGIEPWTGFRLVLGWSLIWTLGASVFLTVLALASVAAFEIASLARAYW